MSSHPENNHRHDNSNVISACLYKKWFTAGLCPPPLQTEQLEQVGSYTLGISWYIFNNHHKTLADLLSLMRVTWAKKKKKDQTVASLSKFLLWKVNFSFPLEFCVIWVSFGMSYHDWWPNKMRTLGNNWGEKVMTTPAKLVAGEEVNSVLHYHRNVMGFLVLIAQNSFQVVFLWHFQLLFIFSTVFPSCWD